MSKEYHKKKLVDLRADIAKKRDNERYASLIKGTSSISSKASFQTEMSSISVLAGVLISIPSLMLSTRPSLASRLQMSSRADCFK